LPGKKEERMAAIQRAPRDVIMTADAEYQRLAEKHHQYEVELQNLSRSPFLNSEDLLEEIRLKKLKLHVKDEMKLLAARIHTSRTGQAQ
jgi:uncharacterized protein YdcH (DUF465 family)